MADSNENNQTEADKKKQNWDAKKLSFPSRDWKLGYNIPDVIAFWSKILLVYVITSDVDKK